jgi:hypothetical protein
MVWTTKYLFSAGILPAIAFSTALALADDHGRMMGRGMMGDSHGAMMGHRMEGCMQMMQGMQGKSLRPNEQWRQR